MMNRNYKTFILSDEPKIAGIPIATGLPVFSLTILGMLVGHVPELFMIGAVMSFFMHHKFGGLVMRTLLLMIHWSLPKGLTGLIFRAFPDSAHRIYVR